MEIRKRALGVALGFVWGLAMLLGTWWILMIGAKGDIFSKASVFYLGYTLSWIGGVIGFIWGFVYGFISGFLIAWTYNIVNKSIKSKTS
jgi:hypothetical protein